MITIGRSLTLNHNEILNISTQRVILLQIKYCLFDFLTCIFNLLTYCVSLRQIIIRRTRIILKEIVKRKLAFLIIDLNFEDMFEVIFIELEILGINVINSLVDRHDFLILIFELFQFALLYFEAAIRYSKKHKHNGE